MVSVKAFIISKCKYIMEFKVLKFNAFRIFEANSKLELTKQFFYANWFSKIFQRKQRLWFYQE